MKSIKCKNPNCGKEYDTNLARCPYCQTENEQYRKVSYEDFNSFLVVIIWISIILGPVRIISSSLTLDGFNLGLFIINFILTTIFSVSLFFILRAKKWAFFTWAGFLLTNAVINDFLQYGFFNAYTVVAVFWVLIIILLLQTKKNGRSAWSIIFNKTKESNLRFCCKCKCGPCLRWDERK